MAEAVVSFAVERLGDLLIEEGKFLYGVGDQVDEIETELQRMQCFLKDADARQDGDERIGNWVAEIRDLAYRTDDVLETFSIKVKLRREGKGIKNLIRRLACLFSEGISLHEVGSEIRNIKARITSLTTSLQTYGVKDLSQGESSNNSAYNEKQRWLRKSYAHLVEEDFVGMGKSEEELMSLLARNDKENGVISIKGMGGQGKTTIATKIYNSFNVSRSFKRRAWVCITQQCQIKNVLQDILAGLLPDKKGEITRMGDTELVEHLHKVQQEMKCLVVLDDIWSTNDWESLKPAFPSGCAIGSKILITSRILEVGFVHELKLLNEEEGWELLRRKAFARGETSSSEFTIDPEMERLGRDMVRQCGGLPLAISVLGGILRKKSTLREWEMVNKDIDSYLRRGGEGIKENYRAVTHVLGLSYNDLPYFLKPCFLYLGSFLEDREIQVWKLCMLWTAEGLVSSDDRGEGETMLDVAERYLGELAQRSMVQVELVDESHASITRKFSSCRLHDLMRDMCLSKGKNENFLKAIDFRSRGCELDSLLVFRLAIYMDRSNEHVRLGQDKIARHLRSLLFFIFPYGVIEFPLDISVVMGLRFLRVLDFGGFDLSKKKLPKGIGKLVHLRYLSFYGCEMGEGFSSSIGNLRYLETLDLRVRYSAILPNILWKMNGLKHLFLPLFFFVKGGRKLKLDGLIELETLCIYEVSSVWDFGDLVKLTNIRYLEIKINENLDEVASLIKYLNAATHQQRQSILHIKCDFNSEKGIRLLGELFSSVAIRDLSLHGNIGKLPKYNHQYYLSSSLTSINLRNSNIEDQDPMTTLEKLPNLQRLSLYGNVYVGEEMVCSAGGFSRLKKLSLHYIEHLKNLHVHEGAMPNLCFLEIKDCRELEMVPEGLRYIAALRDLKILYMPKTFLDRVRVVDGKEGEDFYKIRHVRAFCHALLKKMMVNSKAVFSNQAASSCLRFFKFLIRGSRKIERNWIALLVLFYSEICGLSTAFFVFNLIFIS